MNEVRDNKELIPSEAEAMRLEFLKETLNSVHIHYTLFSQDLIIKSAQEGVKQGLGASERIDPGSPSLP